MLDTVQILIPFYERFCDLCQDSKNKWQLVCPVYELDSRLVTFSRRFVWGDKQEVNIDYFHPQESIPTSYTGIGFKIFDVANNCLPYVVLNCSIAKILQGHNVYGSTDMIAGVSEMLGIFKQAYPDLFAKLDLPKSWLSKFDITLPALTTSRQNAIKIREYLRNVDWGRLRNQAFKPSGKVELNTLYFGSANTKVGGFKVYCKGVELDNVLDDLERQAKRGDPKALHNLKPYTKDVIDYADKSIRIEATCKKRFLNDLKLPTNIWQFLIYQYQNQSIYSHLFELKTKDFMQALDGMRMPYDDETRVYELLCKRLAGIDKNSNPTYTKAKNAYRFYLQLKQLGYYEVKRLTHKATFNRNIATLCDAGFNKAYLQNLTKDGKETPILRLLNLDLNAPLPSSYQLPVSNYYGEFEQYLTNAVHQLKVA